MTSHSKSGGAIVCYVVAIVIMAIFIAWYNGSINPVAHVPTPVMPTPNAFDDFQVASASFRDSDLVDDALIAPAAAKEVGLPVISNAQQVAAANADMPVVPRLRIGLTHPYLAPPIRHFRDAAPKYFSNDRNLVRLLELEGRFAAKQGNWRESANDDIDAIEFGNKIMHGSALIGSLTGVACSQIGRLDCWPKIAHLDSASARSDALRLQAALASRPSLSDILQETEWSIQAGLAEDLRSGDMYGYYADVTGIPGFFKAQILQTVYPKRTIFANFTRYMDQLIQLNRLPYILVARAARPRTPDDPFSRDFLPDLGKPEFTDARDRAFTVLLMTALALRAYRLDHGAYPDQLAEVVPSYLKAVPIDPFSDNFPFRYRNKGASYLLYSIGPDGIDDGGKAFTHTNTAVYGPDTKGDIVAGLNNG